MINLCLKFDSVNQPIEIEFESTPNAVFFSQQLNQFKRPADRIWYVKPPEQVIKEFLESANRAKKLFNFDWDLENLHQENLNQWHRDIETFDLSKYPPWSQEKGDFFQDLHNLLHLTEIAKRSPLTLNTRSRIQIKWFMPSLPWPTVPEFVSPNEISAGDVVCDYPHVGKDPWASMTFNDNTNLKQSCRLADECPPGFVIILKDLGKIDANHRQRQLIDWYNQNHKELQTLFSIEEMLQYDGYYKIGKIKNLNHIDLLKNADLNSVSIV
jgi:hypothetical protein